MGESVVLRVNYEANPKASVRWIFDDNSVTGDNYDVYPDNTLTFVASSKNGGKYECIITNEFGSEKVVVQVEVQGKICIQKRRIENSVVEEGDTLKLICPIKHKSTTFQLADSPEVIKRPSSVIKASRGEWITLSVEYAASQPPSRDVDLQREDYHRTQSADSSRQFFQKSITSDSNSLEFIRTPRAWSYVVPQAEGGVCECTITSCYGSVKILVEILIQDRPRVTAAPPRLIRVKPSERVTQQSNIDLALKLTFVASEILAGEYACIVTNERGSVEVFVLVEMEAS
ncbi:hypothetical protein EVAR_91805_1 [Eumeta japonica]|uniref:Ig-like domain-containing protein n=1 Tax=Eumeta variegata TaxID=151549 RepID=A0A4C1T8J1_EUMVA|nr:hypothetical protein EVAR_91805_1 [Eumeta japonica]